MQIEAKGKVEQALQSVSGGYRNYRPTEQLSYERELQIKELSHLYIHLTSGGKPSAPKSEFTEEVTAKIIDENDLFRADYHQLDKKGVIAFVGLEAHNFGLEEHLFAFEQIQNGYDFNKKNDPSGLHTSSVFRMPDDREVIWKMFFSRSLLRYDPQILSQYLSPETKRHIWVFTLTDLKNFLQTHHTVLDKTP